MSNDPDRRYVDRPAPSTGLMAILLLAVCGVIVAIAAAVELAPEEAASLTELGIATVLLFVLAVLCFYFWPLYSTRYTLSAAGLQVRYGPWTREYPWSDFVAAYWQRGMFVSRIGWPAVTPCVRLSDGVVLKRKARRLGLYLTPNDPRAFLRALSGFAPELTRETIL